MSKLLSSESLVLARCMGRAPWTLDFYTGAEQREQECGPHANVDPDIEMGVA